MDAGEFEQSGVCYEEGKRTDRFPLFLRQTYPLDTKKTRLQSVLLGLSKQAEKGAMQAARSPYMGISVSVIRTTFQNVMLMSFYEYFKKEISKLPV